MAHPRPPLLSLVLRSLRAAKGWDQQELAAAAGRRRNSISRYESDGRGLGRETLEALAEVMGYGPEEVEVEVLLRRALDPPGSEPRSPVEVSAAEERSARRLGLRIGLAVAERTAARLMRDGAAQRADRERQRAAELWTELAAMTPAERRLKIERFPEAQTWAVAERLCAESERAAADVAERAGELAALALRVAQLAAGPPGWQARLQGYAWGFVGNARRVASDLQGADAAFVEAWRLWHAGGESDPARVLAEWRLLDLEASLRRGQRRFAEALRLLDRARDGAPRREWGRIWIKRAATLDQEGNVEAALVALREAAPLIDEGRDPRLAWAARFNVATSLCHLDRHLEAQGLLPEIRERAVTLDNEIDLLRVVWLSGRIAAGLGEEQRARSALKRARKGFEVRRLAYDAALVCLELAALDFGDGRAEDVRVLAEGMAWIFSSQRVHREALAALGLFCHAVKADLASADLARRVLRYLERARHSPSLRFEEVR
jgi:transcriptional regulator with XRE-family HTH domain